MKTIVLEGMRKIAINLFVVDHIVHSHEDIRIWISAVPILGRADNRIPRVYSSTFKFGDGQYRRSSESKMYYGCSPGKTSLHESCMPMNFLHRSGYGRFLEIPKWRPPWKLSLTIILYITAIRRVLRRLIPPFALPDIPLDCNIRQYEKTELRIKLLAVCMTRRMTSHSFKEYLIRLFLFFLALLSYRIDTANSH